MLHFFNPGHEVAVLNKSPYYTAPTNTVTLQRELAFLPAWYADTADLVLMEESVDEKYYSYLIRNLGFNVKPVVGSELLHYPKEEVALWGISPQSQHFFSELNKEYGIELEIPNWEEEYIYLNSRQAASDCLSRLIKLNSEIAEELAPRFFTSMDNIEQYVRMSPEQLLAKAPYSSSGRGLLWLPMTELTRTEQQILRGMLKKQHVVSIEKVLDKQLDFAMEFTTDAKGGIDFIGYSLFDTNSKGAYLSNYIGSQNNIEKRIGEKIAISLLDKIKSDLADILKEKYAFKYKGCIGVDMLIYKTINGEYGLHPCVEINMRSNMGLLALSVSEKYIDENSQGRFYLDFHASASNAIEKHRQMESLYPAQFRNQKLLSGYLPLCPVGENSHYRAYVLID